MISKQQRQELILDIIQNQPITSQEELLSELLKHRVETTQTTVSRDIRALGIVRIKDINNDLRYQQLQDQGETPDLVVTENAIDAAIIEYAVFVKRVQFMTIIRTTDSSGNAVAGIIDDANLPQVIATLAGFDTIYVTSPDEVSAEALTKRWSALIG
ncbi:MULTISPECIES: arginine repressor [Leuconostoc]|uniref:Arginine repressor n=2 Tax=Leuconostoc TaxID=1243 RepID=A0AAN2QVC6_9LACO|nr:MULTISPECIES: arginine repressor [Leuconostoc]MBR2276487.1 arginine repressor [Leuconostoc sp.]MBZ5944641.1 arginine repressor [Leuconostoc gasicomitatum]MBZ5945426.1 arginine repressor [Leuconostoc gasicomitatum]MBZ5948070.1 arginine repressor [Leuconostoc gasicomitatum]MBZ5949467.1 arginine repressor [Leuconostoc gasicomitatum]